MFRRYTIKLQLNEHIRNPEGLYPIYFRITIDRKTSYISPGHYINSICGIAKTKISRVFTAFQS